MTPADTPTPRTSAAKAAHEKWRWLGYSEKQRIPELKAPSGWEFAETLERELTEAKESWRLSSVAREAVERLAEVRRRAQWTKIDDANPDSVPKEAGWFIVASRVPGSEGPGLTRQDFYSPALSEKPNGPSRKVYGKYSRYFEGCRLGYIITHWQPLPEPPAQEALAEFGEVGE